MGVSGNITSYIDYHDLIASATLNQRMINRFPVGIYFGADLSIVSNTSVTVSTFDIEITDGTYLMKSTSSASNTVTVSSTNIYVYFTWSYTGTANDVPTLTSGASIPTNAVVVGKCVYSGSTLNGFDLTLRTDAPAFNRFSFVEPTNPASLAVKVRAGNFSNSTKTFFIAEQITSNMTAPVSGGQSVIYVIAINSTGGITILSGTAASTGSQVAPAYNGNLPLAQITIANGQSTITAANIVDCRPFLNITSPNAVQNIVNQVAHGFSVGNWLRLNGSSYVLAQADQISDTYPIGIVSSVIDANDFVLTTSGYVTGLSALSAGTLYYLSPTSAGTMTSTSPTASSQIILPIFIADSTSSGYFLTYPPQARMGTVLTNLSSGNTYQAATDGYAFGYIYAQAGDGGNQSSGADFYLSTTSPVNSSPYITIQGGTYISSGVTSRIYTPYNIPVAKGEYYGVYTYGPDTSTASIYFRPYGLI
jgi:hypothetical protein